MKPFILTMSCLIITACATPKPALEKSNLDVKVRPVVAASETLPASNFDTSAALKHAFALQKSSDHVASYDAYSMIILRLARDHKDRTQALLGLADSALSLSWRAAKYQNRAHKLYTEIAANSDNTPTQIHRAQAGLLLLNLRDYRPSAAEKHLRAALQDSPNDPRLWNALGKVYDGEQQWLDALDAYIKALSAAKSNGTNTAAVVNNMGMSLLMQGRKQEALAKFKQARKANPDMPVYDNNYRLALILSGNTGKALNGLSETRTAQIYNDAGVIAQSLGQQKTAAHLYKKAIEKSPTYFERAEKNLAGLG